MAKAEVKEMRVNDLLRVMVETEASDLHIKVPSPPMFRIDGELVSPETYPEVTPEWAMTTLRTITTGDQFEVFQKNLELDFSYTIASLARFRVNAGLQRGTVTIAFRLINWDIPPIEELGLPEICKELAVKRGA